MLPVENQGIKLQQNDVWDLISYHMIGTLGG